MVGQVDEGRLVAGRYRLLERIGRGGMGTVWRAQDELLGRQVAVKKLHPPQPHMHPDELATLFERTRREARAAARISHPNVVVVHDVVDDAGLPSIVMEYVPSVTLGERLKQQGRLSPAETARIGRGMIAALRAAHRAGVLHRDVKPGNVLLGDAAAAGAFGDRTYGDGGFGDGRLGDGGFGDRESGGAASPDGLSVTRRFGEAAEHGSGSHAADRVVLTDFGIAQASGTSTLTRTGELIGSVEFLSPERIRGVVPGPEADLWALGATLYQAVEGEPPFRRATAIETAYAIAEDPLRPPAHAGVLAGVISGLLAKEPAERLSAEETERMLRMPAAEPDTTPFPGPAAGPWTAGATQPQGTYPGGIHLPGSHPPGAGDRFGGSAPQPPPYSPPGRARGRRRSSTWIVVVAAVVLVAAAALAATRLGSAGEGSAQAGPSGNPGPTAPVTTPAPTTASPTPPPTTAPARPRVPKGYHLVGEPLHGYSVPVPDGWTRTATEGGDMVNYVDPTHRVGLKISAIRFASTSPYQHWLNLEPATRSQVDDYHRERLDPTTHLGEPAAIWQFTFQGSVRQFRAIDLGFGTPGALEYAVYLSAPAAEWEHYLPVFDTAVDGFRQDTR